LLVEHVDPSRILYGSDFSYAPERVIRMNLEGQKRFVMDVARCNAIMSGNATALLQS